MINKIITSEGNVQFIYGDSGKIINVHPFHVYTVFNVDTVSFLLIAMPKDSGLAIFTTKAEDLEINGETYTFEELPNALSEAFAIAGAQARAEIVDELPETGMTNTIYLVPKEDGHGYDEYIYIKETGTWELIGDTDIELSRYVKKTDFNAYTAQTAAKIDYLSGATDAEVAAREAADSFISGAVDTLSTALANEVQRAQDVESGLSDAIDAEETRALAAEDALDDKIDAVSGDVKTETARAEGVENAISGALDIHIADEVRHITAAERTSWNEKTKTITITQAEYDALPSSAKTDATKLYVISDALPIDLSVYAKVSALTAEESARIAADSFISGAVSDLSTALANEVQRAQNAESGLSEDIEDEMTRAMVIEDALQDAIDAVSGDVISETSRAEAAESDLDDKIGVVSGNVETETARAEGVENVLSGAIDTIDAKFIDDAKYEDSGNTKVINFYNGNTIKATIDCSDFIIDGFVEDVRIENGYLVIDFNTASGVEDIEIPLTDIFNPENYYDKDDVDVIVSGINEDISAVSGVVDTKLAINDFNTYSGNVATELSGKQNTLTPGNGIDITNDVVSFNLPIYAGTGENSIIIGDERSISSGINSVAEGFITSAMTSYAHAEGSRTLAGSGSSGSYGAHAEGTRTSATSECSHSEGSGTTASGRYSHSEGQGTIASGQSAHSEGRETSATTNGAHSEGSRTLASGQYSHSEGTNTKATGLFSHSEGNATSATSMYAHAEGSSTTASGEGSHTEGKGTIALNKYEHSEGYFNVSSSGSSTFGDSGNTLFSVGNGTANDARHNAFEIRQNGDIYLSSGGTDIKLQDHLGGGGGGEVSTAITSGDTNAVAGGAVFDAVVYSANTYNTELTFDANGYAENWIIGQSAITIDVSGYTSDTRADYYFENSNGEDLGRAVISKTIIGTWWTHWDNSSNNCTITTDGDTATTATITDIPSGTVRIRRENESNPPRAIISGDTPEIWIKDALDDHRDNTTVHITAAERSAWNNKSNFSGSYNDLTDKPIPDSALTSYSTNAVQSKTLYDELRINNGGGEAETTLTFEGEYSTNYPNGCTKIKVEGITSGSQNYIQFQEDSGYPIGNVTVSNWGSISVDVSSFQGATYEISGSTVIISYPSVTTVYILRINDNTKYTYKAITSSTTPLKDVVAENTTALGGLKLVKLSQQEYDALAPNYDNNTLYVII